MYVKHETSGCNEKKEVSQVAQMKRVLGQHHLIGWWKIERTAVWLIKDMVDFLCVCVCATVSILMLDLFFGFWRTNGILMESVLFCMTSSHRLDVKFRQGIQSSRTFYQPHPQNE